jgi:hypothetical protein
MKNMMSQPWLAKNLYILLAKDGSGDSFESCDTSTKIVQLLSCHPETFSVVVSDKETKANIFLTETCFSSFNFSDERHILDLFEIQKYHFTTVAHVTFGRFGRHLQIPNVSFPFALNCCQIEWKYSCDSLNGNDFCDLNQVERVRVLVSHYNYRQMYDQLSQSQFPDELQLPQHGKFLALGNITIVVIILFRLQLRSHPKIQCKQSSSLFSLLYSTTAKSCSEYNVTCRNSIGSCSDDSTYHCF